ncbi:MULTISPECIES: PrsW family glutamic-type intramembrane protease [Nocardioides]|uniref:PrsW family glutamic-type intramembrane protease n=1 Tax=Nocardioides vastitatis TaxID=2568655 RepID=A0ABW0ZM58_9ACTN|nr:PrsW family glutamic-type intramembrane protease [Nocardioides sp.]THJ00717.1 PrsW family intramembrane metalloprotease [Nocardioides sp.]
MTQLATAPTPGAPGLLNPGVRRAARRTLPWRWLLVLVAGAGLFAAVSATLVATHDLLFIPSLLLLGAAVVPATFTTLVTESMASHTLTLARVLTAAVLGGVVGAVLAGLLEFGTRQVLGSLPYLMVGLIEEAAKLAVPVALFAWGRSRGRAMDGLVLGVAAGSGFAALETMGYGFVALLASHGQLEAVDGLLITRALASLGAHAAWTGLAAAAWFGIGSARRRWLGRARFALSFATVVILHTLWDATVAGGFYRWIAAISFLLLVGTATHLYRRTPREDVQMVLRP